MKKESYKEPELLMIALQPRFALATSGSSTESIVTDPDDDSKYGEDNWS